MVMVMVLVMVMVMVTNGDDDRVNSGALTLEKELPRVLTALIIAIVQE